MFTVNHDYHIHTHLSLCSNDPEQNVANILSICEKRGYDTVCITDHCWDSAVPGANSFYEPQSVEHIMSDLPLPGSSMRVLFGCETDYIGHGHIGLSPKWFEQLDYINIPLTHFHMYGFVRPLGVETPAQYADLLAERVEEICAMDLPFHKIGIAHLTGTYQKPEETAETMGLLDETRLRRCFAVLAKKGAGIELNASCFKPAINWREDDRFLNIYRWAKEEGCRFYIGSDAHHPAALLNVDVLPEVCERLGITDEDRFIIK